MKRYIKPNTESVQIDLQQMIALSGGGTNSVTGTLQDTGATGDVLGKDNSFFTDPESAEKNEYPVYTLWED